MWLNNALLSQVQHMDMRQNAADERHRVDPLDHLLVVRIPLLPFRLTKSMNGLADKIAFIRNCNSSINKVGNLTSSQ